MAVKISMSSEAITLMRKQYKEGMFGKNKFSKAVLDKAAQRDCERKTNKAIVDTAKPKRKNVFEEILKALRKAGYHEDTVERCKFVLLSPQGFEVFTNLPNKFDYEYLVQTLLDIYKDITS